MNTYLLIIIFGLLGVITFLVTDSLVKNDTADTKVEKIDLDTDKEVTGVKNETKNLDAEKSSDATNVVQPNTVTEKPITNTKIQGVTIDLSNKGLTKAPEYIFKETDTEILNLSNNKISGALQAEVRHLENLIVLDLSNNNFTGVPAEVAQLKNLEVLDLSGNPITGLPNELANLKNLKSLDLRETNYSTQDLEVIKKGLSSEVLIYLK